MSWSVACSVSKRSASFTRTVKVLPLVADEILTVPPAALLSGRRALLTLFAKDLDE